MCGCACVCALTPVFVLGTGLGFGIGGETITHKISFSCLSRCWPSAAMLDFTTMPEMTDPNPPPLLLPPWVTLLAPAPPLHPSTPRCIVWVPWLAPGLCCSALPVLMHAVLVVWKRSPWFCSCDTTLWRISRRILHVPLCAALNCLLWNYNYYYYYYGCIFPENNLFLYVCILLTRL